MAVRILRFRSRHIIAAIQLTPARGANRVRVAVFLACCDGHHIFAAWANERPGFIIAGIFSPVDRRVTWTRKRARGKILADPKIFAQFILGHRAKHSPANVFHIVKRVEHLVVLPPAYCHGLYLVCRLRIAPAPATVTVILFCAIESTPTFGPPGKIIGVVSSIELAAPAVAGTLIGGSIRFPFRSVICAVAAVALAWLKLSPVIFKA